MNAADIKAARNAGNSAFEVLSMVIAAGREYPDAAFAVSQALRMDSEAVEQMEADYDECC